MRGHKADIFDGGLHLVFFADVALQRQPLPACRRHRLGGSEDGAGQLGICLLYTSRCV